MKQPQLTPEEKNGMINHSTRKMRIFSPKPNNKMKGQQMAKTNQLKPLLVTTAHRGVFFGYGEPTQEKIIRLERARMAVYWSADVKGVLGLANCGPKTDCRIGPAVPAITLQDVTAVIEVSEAAAQAWETEPWS